jgi:hypothetical protein
LLAQGSVESPAPPDGFRWETNGTIAVAVPDDWEIGHAPTPNYCVNEPAPTHPYIDRDYTPAASTAACEPFPDSLQTTHVTISNAADPPPWRPESATWRQDSIIIADARVTVVYTADQTDIVHQILASARQA